MTPRKMTTTFDDWIIARKRLQRAQERLVELHRVIAKTARHLDDWINIKAGQLDDWVNVKTGVTNTITMPGFTNWPAAESIRDAAREFRDALLDEISAFNRCPYSVQQRIKRN
jgi:hypothetical protein